MIDGQPDGRSTPQRMKPTNSLLSLLILAVATASAFAVPVTMTRQEASTLHAALSSVQAGLSPVATMAAADDINALVNIAQTLQKGQIAAQRLQLLVPAGPDQLAKQLEIGKSIEDAADKPVTIELTLIDVTPEEIKDAKIAPIALSVIRRFLAPPPQKK